MRSSPLLSKGRVKVACVVPAAGQGRRLKSRVPKPFVGMGSTPLFIRTLRSLKASYRFTRIIIPTRASWVSRMKTLVKKYRLTGIEFTRGGSTRAESVRKGILSLRKNEKWVLIHDMARPFIPKGEIRRLLRLAFRKGAGILAQRVSSTVKQVPLGKPVIEKTLERKRIWLAQTPQIFRTDLLKRAYDRLGRNARSFTDEASLVEALPHPVWVLEGSSSNIKITTPEDLKLAQALSRNGRAH